MRISEAIALLSGAGIENARHDARKLFIHFEALRIEDLLLCDAESHSPALLDAVKRRCEREPLQYILGEANFYRESYTVTPACLIPREDTEILVDFAVNNIPDGARFIDVCTGSGCIAISTLKNTKNTHAVAVDISPEALELAKINAERNGVADRISFTRSDAKREAAEGEFYALLSNPPYVTDGEYEILEPEIYHEPKIAFVGGEDGLGFYKTILELYINKICTGGFFAFEIGCEQGKAITRIASEYRLDTKILKDLSGKDRVAILRRL
ncbi:MAG: peptide chain release factor N(5)-glutamine methyltransferase [Clostridia bacterium]|nr:peptide chain release factor N(5)-glutamine methyltransferase [Clostridia bacterium]